jgi:site-specific DNA-adenine methylase
MYQRLIFIGYEGLHGFKYQVVDTEFKKTFVISVPSRGTGNINVILSNDILEKLYEIYKNTKNCIMKMIALYYGCGNAYADEDIRNTNFYKLHQKSMDKFLSPKKTDAKYTWVNGAWANASATYNIAYQSATTTSNTLNLTLDNAGRYVWGTANR